MAFLEDPAEMESYLRSLSDQRMEDYVVKWRDTFGVQMPESDAVFGQHVCDCDLNNLRTLLGTLIGLQFVYDVITTHTQSISVAYRMNVFHLCVPGT